MPSSCTNAPPPAEAAGPGSFLGGKGGAEQRRNRKRVPERQCRAFGGPQKWSCTAAVALPRSIPVQKGVAPPTCATRRAVRERRSHLKPLIGVGRVPCARVARASRRRHEERPKKTEKKDVPRSDSNPIQDSYAKTLRRSCSGACVWRIASRGRPWPFGRWRGEDESGVPPMHAFRADRDPISLEHGRRWARMALRTDKGPRSSQICTQRARGRARYAATGS